VTVTGDGTQTRSVCYVDDTVAGVIALAMSDEPDPVNIGNPQEISMADLARRIIDLTGSRSGIELVPLPVDDPKVRRPDTTRASEILGWAPRVELDDGLRRTLSWFAPAQAVSAAS